MTAREWPVDHARAWLFRKASELARGEFSASANAFAVEACGAADDMHDNEESFWTLLSENIEAFVSFEEVDRAVAEVYAAAEKCTQSDRRQVGVWVEQTAPDVEVEILGAPCQECGADVFAWPEESGLLPEERVNGRSASHTWLVCQLRKDARLISLSPRTPDPIGELLAKLEAERLAADPLSETHCVGILAESTIRRLTGRPQ